MKPIRLEDLRPEPAEFHLSKTDKTYRLRTVTLADEKWMNQQFGAVLQKVFSEVRIFEICQIVYRLMSEEDKKDFAARDIEETDENGEKKTIRKGGVSLLLDAVVGIPEKIAILKALLQTIGISRPMMDELEKSELEKAELEKKTQARAEEQSVGEQSSTSSPLNTDGLGTTSGDSLPAR